MRGGGAEPPRARRSSSTNTDSIRWSMRVATSSARGPARTPGQSPRGRHAVTLSRSRQPVRVQQREAVGIVLRCRRCAPNPATWPHGGSRRTRPSGPTRRSRAPRRDGGAGWPVARRRRSTTARSACAASAVPACAGDQPVADGGPPALDLLEPQPDGAEPGLGVVLPRDHEGEPVALARPRCWRSMKARPVSSV